MNRALTFLVFAVWSLSAVSHPPVNGNYPATAQPLPINVNSGDLSSRSSGGSHTQLVALADVSGEVSRRGMVLTTEGSQLTGPNAAPAESDASVEPAPGTVVLIGMVVLFFFALRRLT